MPCSSASRTWRASSCARSAFTASRPLIAQQGELESFRRLQQQPAQRERTPEQQLARFFGGRSGNKRRYAELLASALPLERIPPPIAQLLSAF